MSSEKSKKAQPVYLEDRVKLLEAALRQIESKVSESAHFEDDVKSNVESRLNRMNQKMKEFKEATVSTSREMLKTVTEGEASTKETADYVKDKIETLEADLKNAQQILEKDTDVKIRTLITDFTKSIDDVKKMIEHSRKTFQEDTLKNMDEKSKNLESEIERLKSQYHKMTQEAKETIKKEQVAAKKMEQEVTSFIKEEREYLEESMKRLEDEIDKLESQIEEAMQQDHQDTLSEISQVKDLVDQSTKSVKDSTLKQMDEKKSEILSEFDRLKTQYLQATREASKTIEDEKKATHKMEKEVSEFMREEKSYIQNSLHKLEEDIDVLESHIESVIEKNMSKEKADVNEIKIIIEEMRKTFEKSHKKLKEDTSADIENRLAGLTDNLNRLRQYQKSIESEVEEVRRDEMEFEENVQSSLISQRDEIEANIKIVKDSLRTTRKELESSYQNFESNTKKEVNHVLSMLDESMKKLAENYIQATSEATKAIKEGRQTSQQAEALVRETLQKERDLVDSKLIEIDKKINDAAFNLPDRVSYAVQKYLEDLRESLDKIDNLDRMQINKREMASSGLVSETSVRTTINQRKANDRAIEEVKKKIQETIEKSDPVESDIHRAVKKKKKD